MKTLDVNLGQRSYRIHIESGIIGKAGEYIAQKCPPGCIAVVSDENVFALHGAELLASLRGAGFSPFEIVLAPGESGKSLETLNHLYHVFAQHGLNRHGGVIALGGGVVGDVAGLAAATYMRGVPFIQVPTTLLAQVDSSVGGKVAVNLDAGKNLVGAFYQPAVVLSDTAVLDSLTPRDFSSGMAEVIKCGAIGKPALLDLLESAGSRQQLARHMDGIIATCCDYKREIVQRDEFDQNERMALNFGHTFGHAIEKHYGYGAYTHGEAVSMGMVMAARFGSAYGVSGDLANRLSGILALHQLPIECDAALEDLLPLMTLDKKNSGNSITLVLLQGFGKPIVQQVTPDELRQYGKQARICKR